MIMYFLIWKIEVHVPPTLQISEVQHDKGYYIVSPAELNDEIAIADAFRIIGHWEFKTIEEAQKLTNNAWFNNQLVTLEAARRYVISQTPGFVWFNEVPFEEAIGLS